jgi:hypothetical protein
LDRRCHFPDQNGSGGATARPFSTLAVAHDVTSAEVAQQQLRTAAPAHCALGHKPAAEPRTAAALVDALARCIALTGPA